MTRSEALGDVYAARKYMVAAMAVWIDHDNPSPVTAMREAAYTLGLIDDVLRTRGVVIDDGVVS